MVCVTGIHGSVIIAEPTPQHDTGPIIDSTPCDKPVIMHTADAGEESENHGKQNTPDQGAVIDIAKEAKRKGISAEDAETLKGWAKEYGVRSRPEGSTSESHPNRPHGSKPHIHVEFR